MSMTVALCLMLASVQSPGSSQARPNFAGEWLLVAPVDSAPTVARKMTVAQEPTSIKVSRASNAGSESTSYRLDPSTRTTGTSGSQPPGPDGRWAGGSLTLNEGKCGPKDTLDTCVDRSERWWIDQKGLLNIELKTYGPGKRIETKTFIYRRPGM